MASAQQPGMPVIGFLAGGSQEMFTDQLAKFRLGLSETGWTEGQNVRVEYRWAQGKLDRLPALAVELVALATFDALKRDLEFLASSGRDWSDRTRKLAAHLPGLSIFSMGLVERYSHGWQLTNKGQSVLQFMEEWDARPQRERSRRLRTTGTRGLP